MQMRRCACCGQIIDGDDIDRAIEDARLTRREGQIVECLRAMKGQWMSAERIAFYVWGQEIDGGPENVSASIGVHLHRARQKLARSRVAIESRHDFGYRLRWLAPPQSVAAE